jgi:hypothetical protein
VDHCRIPDEEAGEIPAACIVLKPNSYITEREIKEYVADKVFLEAQNPLSLFESDVNILRMICKAGPKRFFTSMY